MSIDVNNESDFEVSELEISSQAQFILRSLHINPAAELSILLIDEVAMTALHEKFMEFFLKAFCFKLDLRFSLIGFSSKQIFFKIGLWL